ncbi:MAG TPA: hypothetical protein VFB21_18790 [Chthonomonadaceae bacterium]|nr:hypothetical protein [Chthonomonadaceae bacterium]
MLRLLLRLLGGRMAHKAAARHAGSGGALDIRFGFALFRDRRVPPGAKLLAVGLGAALVAALIALELPLEGLWGLLLPLLGVPFVTLDGLEMILGPALLGALLLPRLAPKSLVQQIRKECLGPVTDGPGLDVEHYPPVR